MSDYIKREDVKHVINTSKYYGKKVWYDILNDVYDIPSADVTPIRHGHWIKISPAGIYECSECGKNVMTSDIEAYEYCHGCGARMDGENENY